MHRYKSGYSQCIKAKLADYLLSEHSEENIIIASEVPVARKTSIIDMMLVGETKLIGYEIKSDFDSVSRLSKQMESYYGAFNAVYLVCGPSFSLKARSTVRQGVGIMLAGSEGIKVVRKARYRQYPDKGKMVNFLWKKDLPYPNLKSKMSAEELKDKIMREMSKPKLLELVTKSLTDRYCEKFSEFLKARGSITCVQDIDILTIQNDYVY